MTEDLPPTPHLVMDLNEVSAAYQRMRTVLPEVRVHFPVACHPAEAVLRRLYAHGAGFAIGSLADLDTLRGIGADRADVLFSNPVKVPAHVVAAGQAGVRRFVVDSTGELTKIAAAAPGAEVVVRLRTADACPWSGRYGVNAGCAARLMRHAPTLGLQPHGATFHIGTQIAEPAAWQAPIVASGQLMRALLADGIRLTTLNLGGGFPASYGNPPQLQQHAAGIRAALHRHLPYPVQVLAEPGRALVADAGTLVTTVIGTASRSGRSWAYLDTTAGLETGTRVRYWVSDARGSTGRHRWHLTGPGDRQDTVLSDVPLSADLRTGDHVFIHGAGAYPAGHGHAAVAPTRYVTQPEVIAEPHQHDAPAGRDQVYLTATGTTDRVYLTTPNPQPHGHVEGGQP